MPLSLSRQRPWIKICGLTDPATALACADLGADAVGLVFFEKSPRNVTMAQAADICRILPETVAPIGVFVDLDYAGIMEKVRFCGLKGVQLHGKEPPQLAERLLTENLIVIKALFAQKKPDFSAADAYRCASYILVEYGKGVLPGGNAETWDYGLCRDLNLKDRLVLAGGLDPDNVKDAVQQINPAAIDVSSGVEKTPGIKDLKKVARFIQAVRS